MIRQALQATILFYTLWLQGPGTLPVQRQTVNIPALPSPGVAQANYTLGPGDTVKVTAWTGNELLEQTLTLASDGTILVPFYVNKIVKVAGLTTLQVREVLQSELSKYFVSPAVQVLAIGFESKRASLLGEVQQAGNFPIGVSEKIFEYVLQHGGFSPRANLNEVQVTRADGQKLKVNIYDIVLKGDQSQNVALLPGDIVFAPSVESVGKRYFVLGEVRNPGMIQTSEDITLLEAISKAGTLTPAAQGKHVFVVRANPKGGADVLDIAFTDLIKHGDLSRNIQLQNNDIVYVPRNLRTRMTDVLGVVAPILYLAQTSIFLGSAINK